MTWNPFQHQFSATYLSNEGDEAILELHKGTMAESIRVPKKILPPSLQVGITFCLKLEDTETARTSESEALKQLLSELIQ